jgi:hypothetical protein
VAFLLHYAQHQVTPRYDKPQQSLIFALFYWRIMATLNAPRGISQNSKSFPSNPKAAAGPSIHEKYIDKKRGYIHTP